MPHMLRMDTYLMGAPRNRTSLNQSKTFIIGQYRELGKAWLTGRVHFNDPLPLTYSTLQQRRINATTSRRPSPCHQSLIDVAHTTATLVAQSSLEMPYHAPFFRDHDTT